VSTRSRLRPPKPEVVRWGFLPAGRCGIDRQPACRSAVMLIAAEHTEIGSAEERRSAVL